jgi:hypothetical protein
MPRFEADATLQNSYLADAGAIYSRRCGEGFAVNRFFRTRRLA